MTRNEIEIRLNKDEGFALYRDGHLLLSSFRGDFSVDRQDRKGKAYGPFSGTKVIRREVEETYGAFRFLDEVSEYSELLVKKVKKKKESIQFEFENGATGEIFLEENVVKLALDGGPAGLNRMAMNFVCADTDRFFGLGAQVSAEHRGHRIPIWVSEQGNGKSEQGEPPQVFGLTGAHYDSYSPIPFTLMNRPLGLELDTVHRSEFELCADGGPIRLEVQDDNFSLNIYVGDDVEEVLGNFTQATGRPNAVSRWSYGPWIDSFGGPDEVLRVANIARDNNIPASALWAEDWLGTLIALGGEHLKYNWQEDQTFYPDLKGVADALHAQGIRFLTYFNPMIPNTTKLYEQGLDAGYLVKDTYDNVIDLEFPFGAPPAYFDVSAPGAKQWYWGYLAAAVDKGVDGWMSDYGESLPYEARMGDGRSGAEAHNVYPLEWNGSSLEFWQERAPDGDFAFFTRSGYTGIAAHTHMHWFGDQLTSFDRNDGLGSVLPLYLSSSLSGMFLSHSDIGGYTSVGSVKRTYELWARWLEIEAFTPFMRTHHSSNPDDNLQWHSSAETIALFKRYGDWHQRLLPYFLQIVDDAVDLGLPPVRPIWWGAQNAAELYDIEDQILIGQDLLLAPILEESSTQRTVVIPAGSTWRRWRNYDEHFGEVLTPGSQPLSADVDDTILLVRTGSALPVLTQAYDTLALERQGDEYIDGLESVPVKISDIGLLISVGGDGDGHFSHPDFGSLQWEIQSSTFTAATCDTVQVNGNTLGACAGDESSNCFAANRIELRDELTSMQDVICAYESQSMTLNLEVSGLEKIFIEIR